MARHTLARGAGLSLACMALARSSALAQTNLVNLSAKVQYTSTLYHMPEVGVFFSAPTLGDWDAAAHHGNANTGVLPYSAVVPFDHVEAWSDFAQVGAGSLLHTFSRASGYYNDSDLPGGTYAISTAEIHNRIIATNHGTNPYRIEFFHTTHGTMLTAGNMASSRASAHESLEVRTFGASPYDFGIYSDYSSAQFYDAGNTALNSINGTWITQSDPWTEIIPGITTPAQGLLIHALTNIDCGTVDPNSSRMYDISFDAAYGSYVFDGFQAFAQTDFSHTTETGFRAIDLVTGQPTTDVTFEVVGVPAPGAGAMLVLAISGTARRARRA